MTPELTELAYEVTQLPGWALCLRMRVVERAAGTSGTVVEATQADARIRWRSRTPAGAFVWVDRCGAETPAPTDRQPIQAVPDLQDHITGLQLFDLLGHINRDCMISLNRDRAGYAVLAGDSTMWNIGDGEGPTPGEAVARLVSARKSWIL